MSLPSSMVYSVPCDPLLQKAYLGALAFAYLGDFAFALLQKAYLGA